jgi:D-beta-D-heptose 7-phosphate kinase/D-beta-D-heptose 1-phosphate adenosyltransferase
MDPSTSGNAYGTLTEILERCRGREIWVIGDLMLDQYVQGPVERISPEAPVPVVRVKDVEYLPGGAANVARQVAALGGHAVLAGLVGDDDSGRRLIDDCARAGIDVRAVVSRGDSRTTRKLRVLARGQQLLRLDWEDYRPANEAVATDVLQRLEAGAKPDAVILSDYAKGMLSDPVVAALADLAKRMECPVLVDPKRRELGSYRGATVLKPNLAELSLAAGRLLDPDDTRSITEAARAALEDGRYEAMVVTLGDRGMLLVPADGPVRHVPAVRRAVADVTGAGDTAIAVLGAALGAGASLSQAVEIANAAAGLAVDQLGAVAVPPGDIRDSLAGISKGKILDRDELAARAAGWRVAGKRVVFTNGCFDLLHAGHLTLLHEAAQLGDVLVVAINSDASVRRLKGPERPIVSAAERASLLAALSCVDAVTIFDEDTPLETLRAVRPGVLVKGQDYSPDKVVGREIVEADGGRIALVSLLAEKSTSGLVERIRRAKSAH